VYENLQTSYNAMHMTIIRSTILFAITALFLIVSPQVHALTLTPVRVEIAGDPGQVVHGEVTLYNEQAEQKTFYTTYENFEPGNDEDGSPKFVGGGSGLATWIATEPEVSLNPNEKRTIPFTITIPPEAEAGGYFGAIFYGGQNPATLTNGEVSVGGKLGTLVLLSVRGNIEEGAGILDFKSEGGRFFTKTPVTLSYRMSNTGGDRIVPVGDITVTNTFGFKTATLLANEREGSVLPQSARRFTQVWGNSQQESGFWNSVRFEWNELHIGWYTAHARIAWGAEGSVSTARYDFFVIPWQLLVVGIVCVGVAILGLKRYNTWIVSRAQSEK
jgi:hypothetical protein